MKKLLLFSAFAVAACYAHGADYNTLTLVAVDGTEYVLPATGLQFAVADGVLTATATDATTSIPLANLARMYFGDQSGIETLPATYAGTVTVFNLDGTPAGAYNSVTDARTTLNSGLYIAVANGKTYKMAVQ